MRQPHSTLTIPAHEYEILTCDWNKYNDCVIATGWGGACRPYQTRVETAPGFSP